MIGASVVGVLFLVTRATKEEGHGRGAGVLCCTERPLAAHWLWISLRNSSILLSIMSSVYKNLLNSPIDK